MTSPDVPLVMHPGVGLVGPGQHSAKLARSFYSARAAAYLREAIISGDITRGTPLVERQLGETLSVSRGPIRSALHVLEGEGLVVTQPNGRATAAGFDESDLRDLFETRFELESCAVAWGVRARRPVRDVDAALAAIESEGASTSRLVELDIDFHLALLRFSGSRFLCQAWLALAPVIQAVIAIGNRELAAREPEANFRRIVESHRALVAAIRAYDAGGASDMLRSQFTLTKSMFGAARGPLAPVGDA